MDFPKHETISLNKGLTILIALDIRVLAKPPLKEIKPNHTDRASPNVNII